LFFVDTVVEARELVKDYGSVRAVDGVSFAIKPGECFGFLGPNGAGKTTTMRMLYGRILRSGGSLRVLGFDPSAQPREIRMRLGVVPQVTNLDGDLTVLENLMVYGGFFGLNRKLARQRAEQLLDFVQLSGRSSARVWDLSGGMQRRLLIARALINQPELLILDEPTTGLDPQARLAVWQRLSELKSQGVTIVLTTHYMEEASRLCDRLVIMDRARIVEAGTPRSLISRHAGGQVLELEWPIEAPSPSLADAAAVDRLERVGDRLLVFSHDPARALAALGQAAGGTLLRPATLEDVFIQLTGRDLREE
jgi:lipooligosaccharide transport system ATP-binding protein